MSSTMNNMELTRGFEALSATVNDLANRLVTAIPEIEKNIATSVADTKTMYESIRSDILPVLSNFEPLAKRVEEMGARADTEYYKLDQLGVNTNKRLTDMQEDIAKKLDFLNDEVTKIKTIMDQQNQQQGVDAQSKVTADTKADMIGAKLEELTQEVEHHKRVTNNNYQQQQMQLATATNASASMSGSTSSGSRTEPLATHRLLKDEDKLDGGEDKNTIEEWFSTVVMKVNLVYPGAQTIMEWAGTTTEEITQGEINRRHDNTLATTLSIQMYVFLKCKTKGMAANHLRPLRADQGLEAWRVLRKELLGIDGPRQEDEFNAIADLPKLKLAEISKFDNLYVRWESELKKHELVNREYFIGKFRKRQIVYKSLPDEFQKFIDAEVAKGQLQSYEEFIDLIKKMSQHNRFKGMAAPKPLSANMVIEDAEPPNYTHEEWVAYIDSNEGWSSYENGEVVDQTALREVLSLVGGGKSKGKGAGWHDKGKGKGTWQNTKGGGWYDNGGKGKGKFGKNPKGGSKGAEKGKGKGKGAFNGNCHNCGTWGHRAADCLEPKQQQNVRYVSEYYQQPNPLVFMVTTLQDSQVDYRNPWNVVGKSNIQASSRQIQITKVNETCNMFGPLKSQEDSDGEILVRSDSSNNSHDEFPIPVPTHDFPKRTRMPKLPPRVTQSSKKSKTRFCCDGDAMDMEDFDHVISNFEKCSDKKCLDNCCQPNLIETSENSKQIEIQPLEPISVIPDARPTEVIVDRVEHNQGMASRMLSNMEARGMPVSELVVELAGRERVKHNQDMASRMLSNMEARSMPVSELVVELAGRELNLITDIGSDSDVLNINEYMVWVQVPCAVDSGACANVAPGGVFKMYSPTETKLAPKLYGADGSPIDNLGSLVAEGFSDDGHAMKIDFDIAKVTRPLLSVFKMTANGHKVEFTETGGTIQVKGSNKKIQLRQEGRLFMLDLWCLVPAQIAKESPFIRQVAKA